LSALVGTFPDIMSNVQHGVWTGCRYHSNHLLCAFVHHASLC
jgi:hypothetical protein